MTVFVALATFQADAGGLTYYTNSEDRAEQSKAIQDASVLGQTMILDAMIKAGGNRVLILENDKVLTLESLKKQIPKIQYVPHQDLFSPNKNGITCSSPLEGQWLTAKDSGTGRPIVSLTKTNSVGLDRKEWMLLTHESISALGVVDDEYQVTGPLFALMWGSKASGTSIQDLADHPDYATFASTLKEVKLRQSTPRYKMDGTELCYSWKNGATIVSPELDGGTTGIGGGGDSDAMDFKISLLANAESGWKKFRHEGQAAREKETFLEIVRAMGIEPLPEYHGGDLEHYIATIPVSMEFKKSKRTGVLSAYFLISRLEDSGAGWRMARAMIYKHVLEYMVPAKTKEARDRHTLYGGEIAYRRKVTKELKLDDSGPYFLKK